MSAFNRPIWSAWNTEIVPKSAITRSSTRTGISEPIFGSAKERRAWRSSRGSRLMRIMDPLSKRQADGDGERGGQVLGGLAVEEALVVGDLLERIHDVHGHLMPRVQEFPQ